MPTTVISEKKFKVSSSEVVELLRKVGDGEIVPVVDLDLNKMPSCTFSYVVGEWRVAIYWDCDDLDYIEKVISPDGREGVFEDWVRKPGDWQEPTDILHSQNEECYERMEKVFDSVRMGKNKARRLLLRATKEELINATKLVIGRMIGTPWPDVPDEDVLGYIEFLREKPWLVPHPKTMRKLYEVHKKARGKGWH